MNQPVHSKRIGVVDRLLIGVGTAPWDPLCRVVVGFLIIPAMSLLWGEDRPAWGLVPFLLGVLLMLRVLPMIIRKLVPFSDTVLGVWAERRHIAKRYDSYQWQKLFWIGIGLASYTILSAQFSRPRIVVVSICVVCGALGLMRWHAVAARIEARATANSQIHGLMS